MNEIRIFAADDHPLYLKGLIHTIESSDNNMRVEHMAHTGQQALEMITINQPHISILDISMPGIDGLQISRKIKELNINSKVIILSMHKNEAIFNLALDSGASGYVIKDNTSTEIVDCIKSVHSGEVYISSLIKGFYLNRLKGQKNDMIQNISLLTDTEKKVLKHICENKSSIDIAKKLFLSSKTIQNHRFSICKKLNLEGVNSLLSHALQNKYVIDLILAQESY